MYLFIIDLKFNLILSISSTLVIKNGVKIMINKVTLYVKKCKFLFPFLIGAMMCALWGGFFNLMAFLIIGYLGIKVLSLMTKQETVVEII